VGAGVWKAKGTISRGWRKPAKRTDHDWAGEVARAYGQQPRARIAIGDAPADSPMADLTGESFADRVAAARQAIVEGRPS
jgi:hypothetical protein